MNIFLDTSALFKLYHNESDVSTIKDIFKKNIINSIYLSEISKLEFTSTVWKKLRMKEISEADVLRLLSYFEKDYLKYSFINTDALINHSAINLLSKYGKQGLRTLDSIQLATAISLKNEIDLAITYDKLLNNFLTQENIPIL